MMFDQLWFHINLYQKTKLELRIHWQFVLPVFRLCVQELGKPVQHWVDTSTESDSEATSLLKATFRVVVSSWCQIEYCTKTHENVACHVNTIYLLMMFSFHQRQIFKRKWRLFQSWRQQPVSVSWTVANGSVIQVSAHRTISITNKMKI